MKKAGRCAMSRVLPDLTGHRARDALTPAFSNSSLLFNVNKQLYHQSVLLDSTTIPI